MGIVTPSIISPLVKGDSSLMFSKKNGKIKKVDQIEKIKQVLQIDAAKNRKFIMISGRRIGIEKRRLWCHIKTMVDITKTESVPLNQKGRLLNSEMKNERHARQIATKTIPLKSMVCESISFLLSEVKVYTIRAQIRKTGTIK
tara:strand:- start:90 stop:518 length:429 start_codon:yes stop_codon:yes gene_type:complete